MTTMLEQFKAAKAEVKKAQAEATARMRWAFDEAVQQLFAAHPKLESFRWTQYTPYWNDGDTCTFGAHTDDVEVNDGDEAVHEDIWQSRDTGYVSNPTYDPELAAAKTAVEEFLRVFDDDDLLALFGDHVEVVVTATGATTGEYEHE